MNRLSWLASYPKSGNSWMRILLALYRDPGLAEQPLTAFDDADLATSAAVFDELTGISSSDLDTAQLIGRRPAFHRLLAHEVPYGHVLKTHDCARLPDGRALFDAESSARAIYLVRNPLDVAVSYASHLAKPIDEVIEVLANPDARLDRRHDQAGGGLEQYPAGWSDHVRSWTEWDAFDVLVLRYEDLVADTEGTFTRALAFLGLEPDAGRIADATRRASFEVLRRKESESGFSIATQSGAPFFRSGRVGDWVSRLSRAQVDAIVERHRPLMARFGYLPDAGGRPPAS